RLPVPERPGVGVRLWAVQQSAAPAGGRGGAGAAPADRVHDSGEPAIRHGAGRGRSVALCPPLRTGYAGAGGVAQVGGAAVGGEGRPASEFIMTRSAWPRFWLYPATVGLIVLVIIFVTEYAVMLALPWVLPDRYPPFLEA